MASDLVIPRALVDHLLGRLPQPSYPVIGQQLLQQDVTVLEVEFPLLLRQHLRPDGKYLFGRHVFLLGASCLTIACQAVSRA